MKKLKVLIIAICFLAVIVVVAKVGTTLVPTKQYLAHVDPPGT